jgi:hypothetical protein
MIGKTPAFADSDFDTDARGGGTTSAFLMAPWPKAAAAEGIDRSDSRCQERPA